MQSFCFPRKLAAILDASAWSWIALIYAIQAGGSVLFALGFRLDFRTLAFPVGLLFIGTLLAWIFGALERQSTLSRWHWWMPGILYALFIFLLSHQSFSNVHVSINTNSFHPLEYFTLGIFLCWGWYPVLKNKGEWDLTCRVLVMGFLYGISDELHQAFVPGRTPSFVDLFLDLLGLSIGVAIFVLAGCFQKKLKRLAS